MPDTPQPFVVTCHGWSASNWLAWALNRHPDIACGHSSAGILATDAAIFDGEGLARHIPRLREGYVQRGSRPLTDLYRDLAAQKPASHVGTVHTYRLRDLATQAGLIGPQRQRIPVVNLIRHPLDLVVSGHGQFCDLFRIDLNEFSWTLRKVVEQGLEITERICARHGIDPGDYDIVCFFGACVVLGSLKADFDAEAAVSPAGPWSLLGHVRMEDLTRDPAELARLVDQLTGQDRLATPDYLAEIYRLGRINVHNRTAAEGTGRRWDALAGWQRDAFAAFLDLFDLRPAYERLGYDFDFMENGHG